MNKPEAKPNPKAPNFKIQPNKIMEHPDRDIIVRWLSENVNPKEIAKRLADKYPLEHQRHLRPGWRTVYSFKSDFMPNGKLLLSVVEASKKGTNFPQWNTNKSEMRDELMKTDAYQQALAKIVDEEINVKRKLIEVMSLMEDRLRAIYNKISNNGEKINNNDERIFLEYLKNLQILLQQHDQTNRADRAEAAQNVNVNISVVSEQASIIKDAVRETLDGVDPALAIEFMERFSMKMREVQYIEETGIIPLGGKINV